MPSLARFAACALMLSAPLAAQNTTVPAPAPPPAQGQTPAPSSTGTTPLPPAPVTPPPEVAPAQSGNTVTAAPPPPPAPAPEPVTINPDAAYPNGFADPADNFVEVADARRQRGGFPWGLLGLLGLLGLIPLFRRGGKTTRTVYVDRNDPKRVLREEVEE